MNGKHDKDCPLYEEDVDLLPDLECAHLEGCVGEFHDKDCPLYEETDPEKECQHLNMIQIVHVIKKQIR